MSNCTEIRELMSEYIDGELNGSDMQRVQMHLAQCVQCSGLHKLLDEINITVNESLIPPPENLLPGVMERIRTGYLDSEDEDVVNTGEHNVINNTDDSYDILSPDVDISSTLPVANDTSGDTGNNTAADKIVKNTEKNQTKYIILSRVLPMAACLVIILLSLPRITGLVGTNKSEDTNSNQMMHAESSPGNTSPFAVDIETDKTEIKTAAGEADGNIESVDEIIVYEAYNTSGGMDESPSLSVDSDSGMPYTSDISPPAESSAPIVPGAAPSASVAPVENNTTQGIHDATYGLTTTDDTQQNGDNTPDADTPQDTVEAGIIQPVTEPSITVEETESVYYAVITIIGELPEVLAESDLQMTAVDDDILYFTIPRDLAIQLMDDDDTSGDSVYYEINDETAETALVYFVAQNP